MMFCPTPWTYIIIPQVQKIDLVMIPAANGNHGLNLDCAIPDTLTDLVLKAPLAHLGW